MNESTSEPRDTIQNMINFMGEDDKNELPGDEDKGKEKEEKVRGDIEEDQETDEGEENEDEIKLVDDEQGDKDGDNEDEKEEVLALPVKKGVILKKYPNLFKDFPILEKTYYAHQQYSEVFATPDDAREAAERVETLNKFEQSLIENGDLTGVLSAVKEANPESFNKIADEYFEALGKVDREAQFHVAGGVIKGLIVNMIKTARSQGEKGEPLQEAAHIINQYIFGSDEFEPQRKLSKQNPESEEAKRLKEERANFTKQKYEDARDTLNTKVGNILKSTINQNIDPKGGMSDYVKRNAVNDVLTIINGSLREDRAFTKQLDKLWENAFSKNFSEDSLTQIRRAILSKSKTLLPSALKKVRNEAIRGLDKSRTERDRRGPLTPGRSSTESSRGKDSKEKDTRGMRTLDALNALMDD